MFLRGPSVGGGKNIGKNVVGQMLSRRQGLGSRASLLASLACLLRWLCSLLLLLLLLLLLPQHEGVHTHMWAGGRELLLEASVGVMWVDVRKLCLLHVCG